MKTPACVLLLGLWFALPGALAQQPMDQMISAVGTTTIDSQGRHWAYLTWGSPTLTQIKDHRIGVYRKAGLPTSTAEYERLAVTGIQTDPVVIDALLQRAAQLGHSRGVLEERVDSLFGDLLVNGSLSLAAKLSAVIRGALSDPNHCENLVILSRQHAGVAFCLGLAHSELIAGPPGTKTTFELRLHNPATQLDEGVMGRVTVTAGQPLLLPPPGRPMESIDLSPQGDLNVKFLWATSPDLRRVSLASYGFNIYRVNAAYAEQQGFHLAAPSAAALLTAVRQGQQAFQLNRTPILIAQQLDDAEVLALSASPTNYFFSDSNDRATPDSGPPQELFRNGAEFYYFVTARDVLGRDGLVSPGRKVKVCDRMPPDPPLYPRVENVYAYDAVTDQSERRLKVIWRQNVDEAPEQTTGYYIHRWTSLQEMQEQSQNPLAGRIAGPIAPVVGALENEFIDTTPLAPSQAIGVGHTFWYTVRAVDAGACAPGGNVSYNSSPAFGVIREFQGPVGGGGGLRIRCVQPTVSFSAPALDEADPLSDTGVLDYRLVCVRESSKVKSVEFRWHPVGDPSQQRILGTRLFLPGQNSLQIDARWRWAEFGPNTVPRVICRITLDNGKSAETQADLPPPSSLGQRRRAVFRASATVIRTTVTSLCQVHDPVPPDGDGAGLIDPLWVDLIFPNGVKEWRLYRRVDQGPTTLIEQGDGNFGSGDVLPVRDQAIPANPCELCYFIQYLDEQGNAGPLLPLGCVRSEGTMGLPTPILSAIQPLGTADNPRMELKWTCAQAGVDHFEVWVGGAPVAPPLDLSPDLLAADAGPATAVLAEQGTQPPFLFRRYRTRRLGPGFGPGPAFTISARCFLENHWRVWVRAMGTGDASGPPSNVENFQWHLAPPDRDRDLIWPARPLPAPSQGAFPNVLARFIPADLTPNHPWEGIAIRIGSVNVGVTAPLAPGQPDLYLGHSDPKEHAYRSSAGESLLGLVLYRWQVENETYPKVSGDLLQVSPLIDLIAWQKGTAPGGEPATLLRDPFIRLFPEPLPTPNDPRLRGLYVLDTQPVLEGATYQYSLVRFSSLTREPVEVITTNPVTVP